MYQSSLLCQVKNKYFAVGVFTMSSWTFNVKCWLLYCESEKGEVNRKLTSFTTVKIYENVLFKERRKLTATLSVPFCQRRLIFLILFYNLWSFKKWSWCCLVCVLNTHTGMLDVTICLCASCNGRFCINEFSFPLCSVRKVEECFDGFLLNSLYCSCELFLFMLSKVSKLHLYMPPPSVIGAKLLVNLIFYKVISRCEITCSSEPRNIHIFIYFCLQN